MNLIQIFLASTKLAFININRDVKVNKEFIASIRNYGVEKAIEVIKASDIADCGYQLFDAKDGTPIEGFPSDVYVILDGQHRLKAAYTVNAEEMEKATEAANDIQKYDADKEKNLEKHLIRPQAYEPKLVECVNAIAKERAEIKDGINNHIIRMNSLSTNWKASDYVNNASVVKEGDKLITVIKKLTDMGFSISAISRYLSFSSSRICPKSILGYTDGVEINGVNIARGLFLIKLFTDKGFSLSFIKKRYLIDFFIGMQTEGDKQFELACNVFANLDCDAVKNIESKHDDLDAIYNGERKKYNHLKKEGKVQDLPSDRKKDEDERIKAFISDANVLLEKKSAKPKTKKKAKVELELQNEQCSSSDMDDVKSDIEKRITPTTAHIVSITVKDGAEEQPSSEDEQIPTSSEVNSQEIKYRYG